MLTWLKAMIGSGGEELAAAGRASSSAPVSFSISENSALDVESNIALDSAYATGGAAVHFELLRLNLRQVC